MAPKPIVCANTEKNFNKNLNNFLHNFSDKEELLNELDENKNQIIEKYNDEIIKVKASDILWRQVLILIVLHIGSVYGIYLLLSGQARLATFAVSFALAYLASTGITAGAHRLWTHKSYKATWQLRVILMILTSMTFQGPIFNWVRDHRVHHKFTETNADPHNAKRGFFFAHMGWLMVRKHIDVRLKGQTIDFSDLEQDPVVMFQRKYYIWLMLMCTFVLPTIGIQYFLNESFSAAFFSGSLLKYVYAVHGTWSVNSVAHIFGDRPYDRNIDARDNVIIGIGALGEGWHNYHHVFPWDYKTSELGKYSLNFTLAFIDFFAKLGWAYDLKTVSEEIIQKRAERTGDGTNAFSNCIKSTNKLHSSISQQETIEYLERNAIWGWDDKSMNTFDKDHALILNKVKV